MKRRILTLAALAMIGCTGAYAADEKVDTKGSRYGGHRGHGQPSPDDEG